MVGGYFQILVRDIFYSVLKCLSKYCGDFEGIHLTKTEVCVKFTTKINVKVPTVGHQVQASCAILSLQLIVVF